MRKIARTFTPVNRSSDLPEVVGRSPQLADANARLMALRGQAARSSSAANAPTQPAKQSLPAHLGWGSRRLLHAAGARADSAVSAENAPFTLTAPIETPADEPAQPLPTAITLHPELAAAFLKHDHAAAARIWLLLRHLDVDGQGWVALDDARQQLSGKHAALRVCGWRQLRNLLHAGSGTFWERDKRRIWLRSVAKVAAQLDVAQLNRPITIPTGALLAAIQTVRATFYALAHAGRSGRPISRAKLATVTGVNERTQRRYDAAANIEKTANYCLGDPQTERHEQAWQQRHAAFDFTDRHGQHGEAGKTYRAFQLPNSYSVTYQRAAKGRTRKINQQLRQDLVKNRAQGNSRAQVDERHVFGRKLFFYTGRQLSQQNEDFYMKTQCSGRRRGQPQPAFWTHFA